MSITLIALAIFLVFLIAFGIFSAFGVYHLWQFGFAGDLSRPVAVAYLLIAAGIIFLTLIFVLSSLIGG